MSSINTDTLDIINDFAFFNFTFKKRTRPDTFIFIISFEESTFYVKWGSKTTMENEIQEKTNTNLVSD